MRNLLANWLRAQADRLSPQPYTWWTLTSAGDTASSGANVTVRYDTTSP